MAYNEQNDAIAVASISVILYSLLAIVSFYQASKFWDFQLNQIREGLYFKPKFIFFTILGISACFDIPKYVACLEHDSPNNCIWDDDSYYVTYHFYLVSICGYAHSIISVAVLWSDLINHKDGMLWFSSSPLDSTKIFFRICLIIYCLIYTINVILDINQRYTSADYTNDEGYQGLIFCLGPVFLFLIACGCLVSGIRLQRYLIQVKLNNDTQRKALFTLNLIMTLIVCSYFLRALVILSAWNEMPKSYQDGFEPINDRYIKWLPITQWLPFLLCSFLLIYVMRYKTDTSTISSNLESEKEIYAIERAISFDSRISEVGHVDDDDSNGQYMYKQHSISNESTTSNNSNVVIDHIQLNSLLEYDRMYNRSTEELRKDNFLTIEDLKKHSRIYINNPLNNIKNNPIDNNNNNNNNNNTKNDNNNSTIYNSNVNINV